MIFKRILILPIRFYQKFISPRKPRCCRFYPSCSQYAIEAIEEWGAVAGLGLSVWRILRCNPFGKCGSDPVPRRRRRKRNILLFLKEKEAKELFPEKYLGKDH